jgi:cell division protein FtsL
MATITKVPFTTTRRRSQRATPFEIYQAIADTAGALQKYQDVPRLRFQAVLGFLIFTMAVAAVISFTLFMESRIGLAGREILQLNYAIRQIRLNNEDLQSQISAISANESLYARALAEGYEVANADNIVYIAVPGFVGEPTVDLSIKNVRAQESYLHPKYTESLITWISDQMSAASKPLPGN